MQGGKCAPVEPPPHLGSGACLGSVAGTGDRRRRTASWHAALPGLLPVADSHLGPGRKPEPLGAGPRQPVAQSAPCPGRQGPVEASRGARGRGTLSEVLVGTFQGEFLSPLWAVLEKLWLLAGVYNGGGSGKTFTHLQLYSPNAGHKPRSRPHQTVGRTRDLCLGCWCLWPALGLSWRVPGSARLARPSSYCPDLVSSSTDHFFCSFPSPEFGNLKKKILPLSNDYFSFSFKKINQRHSPAAKPRSDQPR